MHLPPRCAAGLVLAAACWPAAAAEPDKKADDQIKEVAGTAEFLRSVPKHFATLKAIDRPRHRVTLLVEGETTPKEWPLAPDAEVKIAGWWGRLDQFRTGDRVWAWFQLDRVKQPVAVSMLCDELTEQDVHGPGMFVRKLARSPADAIVLKSAKGKEWELEVAEKLDVYRGKEKAILDNLKGEKVFVQTAARRVKTVLDAAAFEERRQQQKELLRKRWADEGLPGTVTFLHQFGGEMELMLDHEAVRWGRSLQTGDKVLLSASPPIEGVVKHVKPWRERTQLRLVVRGHDQTDLALGQRVHLRMTPPAAEVDNSPLPPDLDRPRTKEERVEWFLCSVYCTCKVAGDTCTGHFYTLASCNVNACGMPNALRKAVAQKIDQGKTDKQVFEELLKEHGPDLLRPHLLP